MKRVRESACWYVRSWQGPAVQFCLAISGICHIYEVPFVYLGSTCRYKTILLVMYSSLIYNLIFLQRYLHGQRSCAACLNAKSKEDCVLGVSVGRHYEHPLSEEQNRKQQC